MSAAGNLGGTGGPGVVNISYLVTPSIQVTCDAIILFDGSSYSTATNINTSASTGTTGIGGLDTGVVAANTWYAVWLSQNTSTSAVGAFLSLSATNPVVPSGYSRKARVGWIRTDAGAALRRTLQKGNRAQYVLTGSAPNATVPPLVLGATGTYSDTAPTWAAAPVANVVPPTASEIFVQANPAYTGATGTSIACAPNSSYLGVFSTAPPPVAVRSGVSPQYLSSSAIVLEGPNLYAAIAAAGGGIFVHGWRDNL
jgi:hypothetical protein